MKSLAIIPARGGSKRIPRKNIRLFCGQPILNYVIRAAQESNCFDEIMVSTNDSEIAAVARAAGACVPFFRSEEQAGDHATTAGVLLEVLEQYSRQSQSFETACCLYPTAALTTATRLQEGRQLLLSQPQTDTVFSLLKYGHPIQRAFRLNQGIALMMDPDKATVRSQDLEPAYHDAGQWYWLRTASFLKHRALFAGTCAGVVLDDIEAQDIDNEADWKLAEFKMRFSQSLAKDSPCVEPR